MRHIVTFLRTGYDGYDPSVVKMFLTLQDVLCCATDGMITELLGLLPERQGGLFPIATGLFFWRWEVRRACVRLLRRIGSHKIGNRIIERLNPMVRMAYQRAHRDFYGDNLPPGLPVPITPLTLPQSLRSTSSRDTIGSRDGDTRQTIPMRASTPSLSSAYYSSNSVSQRPSIASMREFTQPEYNPQIQAASIARPGSALSSIPSPSTASQANSTFSSSQSQASPLGPAPPTPNNPSSPLNPVVQRMLQQQSRHQEHLKATLSALQIDPSSQVTDTINPEFGKDEQDSDASSSVTSPTAMLALDIIQPWPLPPDRTDSLASNSPGYDEDLNEGNPRRPPNEEYIPAEILLQRGAAKPALLVTASSPATEYTNNPHPVPQRHTSPFPRAPSSPIRSLGASLAPVSPTTLPTTITTGSGQERKRDSGQSGSPAVGSFSPTFGTGGFEGYETLMRFYATDEASVGAGTGSAGTARTEGSVVADDEGLPDDRRRTLYMGDQNEA
ncbi:uncharacterized protein EV422DRAFT_294460 [Fimicolochytrium jonesii]|uniref:uncharacterized protein n=1 Tax=Fimicolochytrium jonesii TaxID=1396493 RepID=UPI0022FE1493|nr:uncharacterized protein EV422DRAFT_294460 [Fimicolochytrium jonesii]KAI8816279.1 hypothetical protein EV422DRAFT_294460 [Fimicolochytrium jonesii]